MLPLLLFVQALRVEPDTSQEVLVLFEDFFHVLHRF